MNNKHKEALEKIVKLITGWSFGYPPIEYYQYSQLLDIAKTALNTPLRNCDIDETPIEQYYRWMIDVWNKCKGDCENCNKWYNEVECFANWSKQKYNGEVK